MMMAMRKTAERLFQDAAPLPWVDGALVASTAGHLVLQRGVGRARTTEGSLTLLAAAGANLLLGVVTSLARSGDNPVQLLGDNPVRVGDNHLQNEGSPP